MPKARKPKLRYHKAVGQWYVRLNGKQRYLGADEAEAAERYEELVVAWLRGREDSHGLTCDDLALLYLKHAETHYVKDGRPTRLHNVRSALRHLVNAAGQTRLRDFGPRKLKAVRQAMIEAGKVRTDINRQIGRIKRAFRWAASEELLPAEVYHSLQTVSGLRKGRSEAVESEPVKPVPEGDVNAVLPVVSRQVRDMIRLQLLSGCRPHEICDLRPCDLDRTGDVWLYYPGSWKTQHHGRERVIFFGPRAQEILAEWIDNRPAEAYCFSPREAEEARNAERRKSRKSPMTPSQAARERKNGLPAGKAGRRRAWREKYNKDSYRKAIHRACKKAGVEEWSPNQLRHSRATTVRKTYGLEAAQVIAGHANADVTQIYAERDLERARDIMKQIG